MQTNKYTNPMGNMQYAFRAALGRVQYARVRECKNDLKKALKIKTDEGLFNRMKGHIEPTVSEAKAIEQIFAKYGVTDNIWGA